MRLLRFLSFRPHSLEEQDHIRQNRSLGIRRVLTVSGLIFLALVAFLGLMLVLPQHLKLQTLHQELKRAEQKLLRAQEEEQAAHHRFLWMMDPEYFEQTARDRANLAKEGEKVIRRPAESPTPMVRPAGKRN